jgi:xeroderma pigmentosum group C-complementing protein
VIQHYSLPRNPHEIPRSERSSAGNAEDLEIVPDSDNDVELVEMSTVPPTRRVDEDDDMEVVAGPLKTNGVIKTMQELAEDAVHQPRQMSGKDDDFEDPVPVNASRRGKGGKTGSSKVAKSQADKPKNGRRGGRKRVRDSPSDTDEELSPKRGTPVKRSRTSTAAASAPTKSDRVLRTRKTKDAAQVEAEREREEAFRRAAQE